MSYFNSPENVGEIQLEKIEREVGCTEEEIAIAKRHGMAAWHLEGLRGYCWEFNRLLILRSSKFKSRRFHFSQDHSAKPRTVGGKTVDGEVVVNAGSSQEKRYFSDYDMLSLWQCKGDSYERKATCVPAKNFTPIWEVIDELNMYIGNRTMFQHGCNDEYVHQTGDLKGKPRNLLQQNETFIAFDERRVIIELGNVTELKQFYANYKLAPWIY